MSNNRSATTSSPTVVTTPSMRRGRSFIRTVLDEWIRQAEWCDLPSIRSFASFLRQDCDAVTAGLTLAYSSGVVEGHVCRVKLLKRSMYGRASFSLLRARILTHYG